MAPEPTNEVDGSDRKGSALTRLWQRFGFTAVFAATALPVFVLVGYLVVESGRASAIETLVDTTERHHTTLARSLANAHRDPIAYLLALDIGDTPALLPIALARSPLPGLIRESFPGTQVIKVKLYAANGMTVYSSQADQIGQMRSDNPGVISALAGTPHSELNHRGEFYAFQREVFDRDVLSTYIPVHVDRADIVASTGVFEIYSDVTSLIDAIALTRQKVLFEAGVPLAALYLTLIAIVAITREAVGRRERRALAYAAHAAESEAANLAKSEFLSRMSHELRTPLNAIIGFADIIATNRDENTSRPGGRDGRDIEYAGYIRTGGQQLLDLINAILDLTALELGKLTLHLKPVDIAACVSASVDSARPRFETSNLTLTYREGQGLPTTIRADPARVAQALDNLLSNAARFTPVGGSVEVSVEPNGAGGTTITIADTGIGMTAEQIEIVRHPFRQVEEHFARKAEGAGLGLTIAERFAELHGGSLTIRSAPGKGTAVAMHLPGDAAAGSNGKGAATGGRQAAA